MSKLYEGGRSGKYALYILAIFWLKKVCLAKPDWTLLGRCTT